MKPVSQNKQEKSKEVLTLEKKLYEMGSYPIIIGESKGETLYTNPRGEYYSISKFGLCRKINEQNASALLKSGEYKICYTPEADKLLSIKG